MSGKTKGNFNSCNDFLDLVTTSHILAAAMEYLKMESLDDEPSDTVVPDACNVWTKPQDQRKHILDSICGSIVDKYIPFVFKGTFKSSSDQVCLLINFTNDIEQLASCVFTGIRVWQTVVNTGVFLQGI